MSVKSIMDNDDGHDNDRDSNADDDDDTRALLGPSKEAACSVGCCDVELACRCTSNPRHWPSIVLGWLRQGWAGIKKVGAYIGKRLRWLTRYEPYYGPVWTAMKGEPEDIGLVDENGRHAWHLPFRPLFLFIGLAFYSYLVFSELGPLQHTSVKSELDDFFKQMHWNVTWPDHGNGSTIFDNAMRLYKGAAWAGWYLLLLGFVLLLVALGLTVVWRTRFGLNSSRWVTYVSLLVLFAGILGPSLPNYLHATNLDEVVPCCAPKFDTAVRKVAGDLVGVTCAALFTMKLFAALLAIVPAFVRAARLILGSSTVSLGKNGENEV